MDLYQKNKRISYGSPVLFQVKSRKGNFWQVLNLECDEISDK